MHILIIVENLPVPFDRRVWNEANALRDGGHEVSIICPKGVGAQADYERLDGIDIYRHWLPQEADGAIGYLAEYGAALFHEFRLAWKVWRKKKFQIIHACNPPDLIFLVAIVFKMFGVKFVFDHHDLNPELYEAKFGRKDAKYKLICLAERLTFRAADIVISTNESYKQVAVTRGGVDPDNVFVVRSGPNTSRLTILPPNERHLRGGRFLVGYVGVIGRQEGIENLLQVAKELCVHRGRADIRFVIIGSGPDLERVRNLSHELDLNEFVLFTGRVSDAELLEILNSCHVCVNPDACNAMNDKSTMNKVMEYMALGKPVVQFDFTEGRVSAQKASLYARWDDIGDFSDKIAELLDDAPLRQEMSKFGQERVRSELSWDHEKPKLLQAYAKVSFGHEAT